MSDLARLLGAKPPFTQEGPQLYAAAAKQNAPFAKRGPYDTKLGPLAELLFRSWVARNNVPFDSNARATDYDMRGFWQQTGGASHAPGAHFPDTFKTPLDTSFSAESRYAKQGAPVWRGNTLVDALTRQPVFRSRR
jgi:hypothetical protein